MAYKIKLNNKEYTIKDGIVIKDELNETLDSAVVVFYKTGASENIESFDKVEIYNDSDLNNKRIQLVDTMQDFTTNFKPTLYGYKIGAQFYETEVGGAIIPLDTKHAYNDLISGKTYFLESDSLVESSDFIVGDKEYTLTLFSETKELERITCPNLATTNVEDDFKVKVATGYKEVRSSISSSTVFIPHGADTQLENVKIRAIEKDKSKVANYIIIGVAKVVGGTNISFLFSSTQATNVITGIISYDIVRKFTHRSVFMRILEYVSLYAPQIKVAKSDSSEEIGYYFAPKYRISDRVELKFENVECPELQWNNPTLREVLNDLFSVKNCIPVVRNGEIDYIDLLEKGDQIDTSKLHNSSKKTTSSEYCSELQIDMKNAIGSELVHCVEYKALTTDSGAEINTNNACFVTEKPIYDIKKLTLCFFAPKYSSGEEIFYHEVDLTSQVVEQDLWASLSAKLKYNTMSDEERVKQKYCNFYYKRGENAIKNILTANKIRFQSYVEENVSTLEIVLWTLQRQRVAMPAEPLKIYAKIEYETISEERSLRVGRYLPQKNYNNRIFDSQTNSYVDAKRQSVFEYAKANRLSNEIISITGTYKHENDIPKLGDYIGDYVLFSREISYHDDFYVMNGYVTKNYILRDYFTGVQSKKRSFAIAEAGEALTRAETVKFYLESSFTRYNDPYLLARHDLTPLLTALSTVFTSYGANENIKFAGVGSIDYGDIYYPTKEEFATKIDDEQPKQKISAGLLTSVEGLSLCFDFGFTDNLVAGYYVDTEKSNLYREPYTYGNSNTGECFYFDFTIYSQVNPSDGEFTWATVGTLVEKDDELIKKQIAKSQIKPLFDSSVNFPTFRIKLPFNKDQRELINCRVQLELCSDTDQIVLTSNLLKYCSLVNSNAYTSNFRVFVKDLKANDNKKYRLFDEEVFADSEEITSEVIVATNVIQGSILVQLLTRRLYRPYDIGADKVLAVTDQNGNIFFAINTSEENHNGAFFINIFDDRNHNVYADETATEIVGTIKDTFLNN